MDPVAAADSVWEAAVELGWEEEKDWGWEAAAGWGWVEEKDSGWVAAAGWEAADSEVPEEEGLGSEVEAGWD